MAPGRPSLGKFVVKTMVTHTVTYFLIGLAALWCFDYARKFAEPGVQSLMRQIDEPLVMAGPLFQPIRGLLFGLVFYLLRHPLFEAGTGWLALWLVLVVVGILGTFGPAPGSLEGMVYTTLPLRFHLESLPEIVVQELEVENQRHAERNRCGSRRPRFRPSRIHLSLSAAAAAERVVKQPRKRGYDHVAN